MALTQQLPIPLCFQTTSHGKTRLSGYGVELAIKSTEYKAKDDTKVEGNENELLEEKICYLHMQKQRGKSATTWYNSSTS